MTRLAAIGLALAAGACGGSRSAPEPPPRAGVVADAGVVAPPDARPPTACEIYQTSVAPALGRMEAAVDVFFEARDPAAQRTAGAGLAEAIDGAHKGMSLIRTGQADLDRAHAALLASLPPLRAAMGRFVAATNAAQADGAMNDFRAGAADLIAAIGDLQAICPELR